MKLVFDFFPAPVFLVDAEACILDFNVAAGRRFAIARTAILQQRLGDAQHCLHAHDVVSGCGTGAACRTCVLRETIGAAIHGAPVVRRPHQLELAHLGSGGVVDVLITANLFPLLAIPAVLLVIEDINEIARLRGRPQDHWSQFVAPRPAASGAPPSAHQPADASGNPERSALRRVIDRIKPDSDRGYW